jgi:hypothetical protein
MMINNSDFFSRYLKLLHLCKSNKEAWEQVEEEWKAQHGRYKYTSYESFRVGKTKHFNRKR